MTIYALPRFVLPPADGVGFRLRGVEWAAVPAAAVDEDGQALRSENEVRVHLEGLHLQPCNFPLERSSSPPAGDAVGAKDCESRSSVAALPRERMADITAERFLRVKMSIIEPRVRRCGALTTPDLWKT